MDIPIKAIQQLSGATEATARIWKPYMDKLFPKYGVTTPERIAAFLSQTGYESNHLFRTEEYASGAEYEGRSDLGNTQPGDGIRFKGRGLIQITGRANYASLSKYTGKDFVGNPQKLAAKDITVATPEQLQNSLESALWFWTKQGKDLNLVADTLNLAKPVTDPANAYAYNQLTNKINYYEDAAKRQNRANIFEKGRSYAWEAIKKNPRTSIAGGLLLLSSIFLITYYLLNKKKGSLKIA